MPRSIIDQLEPLVHLSTVALWCAPIEVGHQPGDGRSGSRSAAPAHGWTDDVGRSRLAEGAHFPAQHGLASPEALNERGTGVAGHRRWGGYRQVALLQHVLIAQLALHSSHRCCTGDGQRADTRTVCSRGESARGCMPRRDGRLPAVADLRAVAIGDRPINPGCSSSAQAWATTSRPWNGYRGRRRKPLMEGADERGLISGSMSPRSHALDRARGEVSRRGVSTRGSRSVKIRA